MEHLGLVSRIETVAEQNNANAFRRFKEGTAERSDFRQQGRPGSYAEASYVFRKSRRVTIGVKILWRWFLVEDFTSGRDALREDQDIQHI